jgi:hypothetical protein
VVVVVGVAGVVVERRSDVRRDRVAPAKQPERGDGECSPSPRSAFIPACSREVQASSRVQCPDAGVRVLRRKTNKEDMKKSRRT